MQKLFRCLSFLGFLILLCLLLHKTSDTFAALSIHTAVFPPASSDAQSSHDAAGSSSAKSVFLGSASNATPSNPVLPDSSPQIISSIFNLPVITQPYLVEKNDLEKWEYLISRFYREPYIEAYGVTDTRKKATLKVENLNYEDVNLAETGTYIMTVTFDVDERYSPGYFLPDELKTHSILVHVYDQENFLIFYAGRFTNYLNIVWGFPLPTFPFPELWYIESETSLTLEELEDMEWKFWDNGNSSFCQMELKRMHVNHHYYVRVHQQEYISNVLDIVYDGNTVTGEGIGGQRDEGGRGEASQPSVTIPPPNIPPSGDTQNPSSSDNASNESEPSESPGNSDNSGDSMSPSNPGNSGDSTSPGNSGNSGDSTNPSNSGNSGDSTSPGNSGNSGDSTSPGNSGNSGDSTNPSSPGNSGNSGDSTNPGSPGNSGDSTNPSSPGNSGNSGDSTNPGSPGNSGNSGDSTSPSNPGNSGDSTNPGNPGNSGDSTNPSSPGNSGDSTSPGNSGNSGDSTNPSNPGNSSDSASPGNSGNSGNSFHEPESSGNPKTSDTSADSDNSSNFSGNHSNQSKTAESTGETEDIENTAPSEQTENTIVSENTKMPETGKTANSAEFTSAEPTAEEASGSALAFWEEDTEDYTVFSGRRLLYMRSNQNTEFLRFKKHHIVIDIPWNWTYFDTITESSSLKVLLLSNTAERFTLSILTDGKTPDVLPEISIYLPWDSEYSSALSLQNLHTGNVFPLQYLAESRELYAKISESGTFVLNNPDDIYDDTPIKYLPHVSIVICLSILAVLLAAGGIYFWKHTGKKKGTP